MSASRLTPRISRSSCRCRSAFSKSFPLRRITGAIRIPSATLHPLPAGLSESRAHEADVLAQEVDLIGERAGKLQRDDALLDLVEAPQEIGALLRRGLRERRALERHQLRVALVDALADAPAV